MAFGKKEEHDFYGKEVTDAIKKACETFAVPQEELDIEIVFTGSAGIFGLIRKKAHIRAFVKQAEKETAPVVEEEVLVKSAPPARKEVVASALAPNKEEAYDRNNLPTEVSDESIALIEQETLKVIELMKFTAVVKATAEAGTVRCVITTDFEDELTGQDGKTLDSLQYIIRKIVVKRVEDRLRINLDVNDFRTRRLEELKQRAVELASKVKEDGKTQVITSLNPSERRAIHMILQEDKEIRSRSIGDGLFKKILIYKPGNGNRGGRKRYSPGRKDRTGKSETPVSDES
ncbi:Jag family protein [Desulfotalea psychrophila]|uniref:RNA-binding protein KhpB n=1 Tax=Desulfotalea psychrophila (strain LSv54 / DSM 12343) TaxID=177439 RepID=Q6APY8_DESPS|nr:Jag N-terminal domain-containing protein [Desulfotalea psychrophila]CAG35585.1 hypothetical protein DP0856 [Desulfotalea psychrophila LSv54]